MSDAAGIPAGRRPGTPGEQAESEASLRAGCRGWGEKLGPGAGPGGRGVQATCVALPRGGLCAGSRGR